MPKRRELGGVRWDFVLVNIEKIRRGELGEGHQFFANKRTF